MWTKPGYTPEQQARTPPVPSGREIAVFERPGKGRGPDQEMRVDLSEYMGHPFISLRVWSKGADGAWYPTRRGLSVKIREAENLANSLLEAARLGRVAEARPAGLRSNQRRSEPAP